MGEEEGYSTAWFAVPGKQQKCKFSLNLNLAYNKLATFSFLGMYGGFSLNLNVAENELTADSWCRVAGGSEERHVIDK